MCVPMDELDKLKEKLHDDDGLLLDEVICGDYELLYIDTLLSEIFGAM